MNNQMFVYGSLMEGFFNFDKYVDGHVVSIEKAYVLGTLYDMPYKGYPALLQEGNTKVWGEIITVKDLSLIIDDIDAMEGFNGRDDDEYKRIPSTITKENGDTVELGVYFYNLKDQDVRFDEAILLLEGSWRAFKTSKK